MSKPDLSPEQQKAFHAKAIDRLFARLTGIFGTRFTGMFANGQAVQVGRCEDGSPLMGDAGVEHAKSVWCSELQGFDVDALRYALENIDPKFPPSALDIRDLARKAPRKPAPSVQNPAPLLGYTATEEDIAEAKRRMQRMQLTADRDPLDWARRPVSPIAVRAVIDTAKRDSRFRAIVADLDAEGVIDANGKALKLWNQGDKAWRAAA